MNATHVALLRGINVGKAKRVAMADLRALLERLGYRDPRTLLNSGNAVFAAGRGSPASIAARIEQALLETVGVACKVIVLTAAEFSEAARENPLASQTQDPARLLVAFLGGPTADRPELATLARQTWRPEALALGTQVAYLWCAGGILDSRLLEAFGRAVGGATTARNWTTVTKLAALLATPVAPPKSGAQRRR